MERSNRAGYHVLLLVLGFAGITLVACVDDEAQGNGVEVDTPPFVNYEDITPNPDRFIVVDRSVGATVDIGVLEVRDWNAHDQLLWDFTLLLPSGPLRLIPATLLPESAVANEVGYSSYEGVSVSLDTCNPEFSRLPESSVLPARLRITDQVTDTAGNETANTEYTLEITWEILLLGECQV